MTIEEQKTDLIGQIGYYRQELDRLEDFRLALGRPMRSLLLELIAGLEEELFSLSEPPPPKMSGSIHALLQ